MHLWMFPVTFSYQGLERMVNGKTLLNFKLEFDFIRDVVHNKLMNV
jgi:hypothetical protein